VSNLKLVPRYNEFAHNLSILHARGRRRAGRGLREFREGLAVGDPREGSRPLRLAPAGKQDIAEWIPALLTRDYPEPVTFADLARHLAYE
jgi:hypothetical protein